MTRSRVLLLIALAAVVVAAIVGVLVLDDDDDDANETAGEGTVPAPVDVDDIDPADFTTDIDNPYLPLRPGSRWVYEGETDEGVERTVVTVTDDEKTVMGVDVLVVRDTVSLDGEVIEDTYDWFAQDREGNVWYFGEDTHEYEDGKPINDEGAWEAGVDGAVPGIVMKAEPEVGDRYRQEYYEGEAEDMAVVLELDGTAEVPFGTYDGVLVTEDSTPLEPGVAEHKYYARGVGLVLEVATDSGERNELIEHTG